MKKVWLCLLLLTITFSLCAQSSDAEKERRFSIQVNPVLLALDIFEMAILPEDSKEYAFLIGVEFQYALTKYFTLSIEPIYGIGTELFSIFKWGFGNGCNIALLEGNSFGKDANEKIMLFTVNPGLLYKPFGTTLRGWYIGIYPTIGWANISRDSYKSYPKVNDDFFIIGVTIGTGYQWIFDNGFTMLLGGGLGRTKEIAAKNNTGIYDRSSKHYYDSIVNFKLGYSF